MTQTFKTLGDAIALAEFAHRNQTDKAGLPYIDHPKRVLAAVQQQGALPYVQMAAVLHDVTEDTAFTLEMLTEIGIPEAAVEIIKLMDRGISEQEYKVCDAWRQRAKNAGQDYLHYSNALHGTSHRDDYYYESIKRNPGALQVKLADIDDNTQSWRLAYLPQDTQARLEIKYTRAKKRLNGYQ